MIAREVNESRRKRELIAKKTPLIKLPNTKKKKNPTSCDQQVAMPD